MGASTFWVVGKGETAAGAFRDAVAEAQHEYGRGGYTGTIAEKREFKMIVHAPMSSEEAEAHSARLLDCDDPRVADKWGPAGCIPLASGGWLFFGWASS